MTLKSDILGYPKMINLRVILDTLFNTSEWYWPLPNILHYHTGLLLALTTCSGNTTQKGCPKWPPKSDHFGVPRNVTTCRRDGDTMWCHHPDGMYVQRHVPGLATPCGVARPGTCRCIYMPSSSGVPQNDHFLEVILDTLFEWYYHYML